MENKHIHYIDATTYLQPYMRDKQGNQIPTPIMEALDINLYSKKNDNPISVALYEASEYKTPDKIEYEDLFKLSVEQINNNFPQVIDENNNHYYVIYCTHGKRFNIITSKYDDWDRGLGGKSPNHTGMNFDTKHASDFS